MAEVVAVVGIIASVLGIIDGIDKSKNIFKKYVHSSSSLRAELLPILGKLSALAGILRGLQLQCELDEINDDRLKALAHLKQPLKASEEAVRLIATRLDQVVSLGRVSLAFGKVLDKETAAALHILDQARPVLDLALAADQRTLVKSIENYVRNVAQDLQDARLESKIHYDDITGQLHDIQAKQIDATQVKLKADILAWISQTNYTANYQAARQPAQHVDNSGDWFIAGKVYQGWTAGRGPSRLWLKGISGCGKTVLCAKAIEHLSRTTKSAATPPTILYFFFDFNDTAKETVKGMIRALLSQLLSPLDSLPADVQDFYSEHQASTSIEPSLQSWVDLLAKHLQSRQNVYIFIDALDECRDVDLPFLKVSLAKLLAATDDQVRWLFTSRPNVQSATLLAGVDLVPITMESATVDKDIETYLTTALRTDPRLLSFTKTASTSIITEITARSSGMFRYAHCQLETVAKLRDRRAKTIQQLLHTMPKTITESYQRILNDAEHLDDWVIISRILLLVSFSKRPVTVAEVSDFAIVEDLYGLDSVDLEDRYDLTDAFSTISPLVTVREGLVTLAHKSVHDFFAEASEPYSLFSTFQDADVAIATKCLQYLRIPQQPMANMPEMRTVKEPNTSHLNRLLKDYPFLDYAANYWSRHLPTKDAQEEAKRELVATLPLIWEPNLWKAWLMLQKAEIWENQIQLAGILCEALIQGAAVPGWSQNFWLQRQTYRMRTDGEARAAVPPLIDVDVTADGKRAAESMSLVVQSQFWIKAVIPKSGGAAVTFYEGDLIFIKPDEDDGSSIADNMSLGFAVGSDVYSKHQHVERSAPALHRTGRISGDIYHELAIVLLEIAFQRPLSKEAMIASNAISSVTDLANYLDQLRRLTSRAVKKMGLSYGKIIDECLSAIKWLDDPSQPKSDVYDDQEACVKKVSQPLAEIRSSGFRASRTPVKRQKIFQSAAYAPTTFVDGYVSSAMSAPYRTATSDEYTSYSTRPSGSAPPVVAGRAMSAEPRWASASATFVSQSATYYSSPSPGIGYRPSSTSATAVTYSASYAVGGTGSASLMTTTRRRLTQSPSPAPSYPPAQGTNLAPTSAAIHYGSPLAIMDTVPENDRVETLLESGETSASNITNARSPSGGQASQVTAGSPALIREISTIMTAAVRGPDDLSTLQAAEIAPDTGVEGLSTSIESILEDDNPTDQTPIASRGPVAPLDTASGNDALASAPTISEEANDQDIMTQHLRWDISAGLVYNHFAGKEDRPGGITVSDDEWEATLDNARGTVVNSDDAETQLLWARDALEHVRVAADNRSRMFRATAQPVEICPAEEEICSDALKIVNFLAEQKHPEAMYLLAKHIMLQTPDHEPTDEERFKLFKPIADMGHAGASYQVALALKTRAGLWPKFLAEAKAGGSAAAIHQTGLLEIFGTADRPPNVKSGVELLLTAAEYADSHATQALYTLALLFAHEWDVLEGSKNPAPKDDKRAIAYLKRASFFGSGKAQARLAMAYEFGELGLEANLSLALHYYLLAARRGMPDAEMGVTKIALYLFTDDTTPPEKRPFANIAYVYAVRATLDELPNALFAVGYYHEIGIHVDVDVAEAIRWYEKAAAKGSADAVERLSHLKIGQPNAGPDSSASPEDGTHPRTDLQVDRVEEPPATVAQQPPLTNGEEPPAEAPPKELSEKEVEQIMAGVDLNRAAEPSVGSTNTEKEAIGHPRRVQATSTGQPVRLLDEDVINQLKTLKWKEIPWSHFYEPSVQPGLDVEVEHLVAAPRPPPQLPVRHATEAEAASSHAPPPPTMPPPPPPRLPPRLPGLPSQPLPPAPPSVPPPPLPERKAPMRPPMADRIKGKWARQKDSIVGAPIGWRAMLVQRAGS